jgi:hypothetical protein
MSYVTLRPRTISEMLQWTEVSPVQKEVIYVYMTNFCNLKYFCIVNKIKRYVALGVVLLLVSFQRCLCILYVSLVKTFLFLDAFANSVRPSAWNNSAPTGRILMKFCIWAFYPISDEEIQALLKSDKNNGYVTWRRFDIYDSISLNSS